MPYSFRVCVRDREDKTTGCDYAGVLVRMRVSFCSKKMRLWLITRALLSALALHQQRAAEIRRKHSYENLAAVAKKEEKNILIN